MPPPPPTIITHPDRFTNWRTQWITRPDQHHPATSKLSPVLLSICTFILFFLLFFSFSQRETHENKEIFYRCLAASNFPSGHPWEPYIFTYGKPSLDFMGWIVLGFCEKRRSKILTVCGKTELEWESKSEKMFWSCDSSAVTWKTVWNTKWWVKNKTYWDTERDDSILWCQLPGDCYTAFTTFFHVTKWTTTPLRTRTHLQEKCDPMTNIQFSPVLLFADATLYLWIFTNWFHQDKCWIWEEKHLPHVILISHYDSYICKIK